MRRGRWGRTAAAAIAPLLLCVMADAASSTGVAKSTGPPAFFLQDPNDGLCLSGPEFKRCGIDTLWYVTGRPGSYQVHHRKVEETDDELCLDKINCAFAESATRLGSCKHCGAKKWNILGDQDSGYVLSEDGGKNCMHRDGTKAKMVKCDDGYTAMTLQFATRDDIKTMESLGARLITAAGDGDKAQVKAYLEDGIDVNSQDWDNLTSIIAASSTGHMDIVKLLNQKGADVNARDKDNITALMEAAIAGHKNIAEFLVKQGSEVDSTAASGVSALWLAAGEGKADLVKYLLNKGAKCDNKRMDGITALMAACIGGHLDVAKLLINAGSDVQAVDQDGLSAIMNAAENGSVPVVSYLIDHGASPTNMSTTGFTPLIVAAAGGHLGVVETLISRGAEVDVMHPEGVNALMYAAAGGHEAVVSFLIEKGAAVNALHSNGGSALMEAATAGNISVVKKLIEKGADVMIVDNDKVTALMSAASQGHLEASELLIELGVPVDAVADSGGTALMFAAGGGHLNVSKLLLAKGSDPNIRVKATDEYIEQVAEAIAKGTEEVEPHVDGVTSLHVAATGGHLSVIKLLLENGANPRVKDDEDKTPLLNAVDGNFGDVAFSLVENGADPNDVYVDKDGRGHNLLWDSIVVENKKFAALLVAKGANLEYTDEHNVTVLIQVAHKGQLEVVEALLAREEGAIDVSAKNDEGITALIAASSEGHFEIVDKLVSKAKDGVDAQDKDGTTALMAAAVRGHAKVVELLIVAGAGVNMQNMDGHTALMFAYNGRNQVASLLDKYSEYMTGDGKDDNSTQIIHKALETHSGIVELLLSNGADANLKDKKGNVAADFDYKPPVEKPTASELSEASSMAALDEALGEGSAKQDL